MHPSSQRQNCGSTTFVDFGINNLVSVAFGICLEESALQIADRYDSFGRQFLLSLLLQLGSIVSAST
jgi:hypothetical protein